MGNGAGGSWVVAGDHDDTYVGRAASASDTEARNGSASPTGPTNLNANSLGKAGHSCPYGFVASACATAGTRMPCSARTYDLRRHTRADFFRNVGYKLAHRDGFASQKRLIDLHVCCLDQLRHGRHAIAFTNQNQVTTHHLAAGDALLFGEAVEKPNSRRN